ncbi:MAG: hypothetical protein ACD_73C00215G0003 [uncultured bacterium]|nr:MAG: hypothetical protein ACD_73C00215G0003 [uncultured bacterium]
MFLQNAQTFDTKRVDDIIQFNYGIYYYKQKKYNEALSYFEETIKINSDYYRAYLMLADCYYYLNEPDLVVTYMEQGLSRSPYNQEDRRYLIKFLLDYGRVDEAVYHAIRFGDYASNKEEGDRLYEETKRLQR